MKYIFYSVQKRSSRVTAPSSVKSSLVKNKLFLIIHKDYFKSGKIMFLFRSEIPLHNLLMCQHLQSSRKYAVAKSCKIRVQITLIWREGKFYLSPKNHLISDVTTDMPCHGTCKCFCLQGTEGRGVSSKSRCVFTNGVCREHEHQQLCRRAGSIKASQSSRMSC